MTAARLRPPAGGMAPPSTATLPGGMQLDLRTLAREVSEAHLARHPEDLERYGDPVREWCIHDNQHLLGWAALDLAGATDLDDRLRWLARILTSRGYPSDNLVDNVRSAAAVVRRQPGGDAMRALADRLAAAADALADGG